MIDKKRRLKMPKNCRKKKSCRKSSRSSCHWDSPKKRNPSPLALLYSTPLTTTVSGITVGETILFNQSVFIGKNYSSILVDSKLTAALTDVAANSITFRLRINGNLADQSSFSIPAASTLTESISLLWSTIPIASCTPLAITVTAQINVPVATASAAIDPLSTKLRIYLS